ncbi:MAG: hypothetical protein QXH80_01385, partial [Candidatus Nanoarchaeia archaeon]
TYSPSASYRFNATWTDNIAVNTVLLEFGGTNYTTTNVGSVYTKTFDALAAGTYNYRWYANDTANNWNSTPAFTFTIDKAITALLLSYNPSSTVSYGTQSNVSCTANNAESSPTITRGGVGVSNPDVQTLAAGNYNYACTSATTQNYTSGSTAGTLTVNKASPVVNLTLNGQDSDLTVDTGTTVNIIATLVTPAVGDLNLTENGVQINYGASPLTNSITYNTADTYAIEASYAGNENYTAGSESHTVTVQSGGGGGGGGGNRQPAQNTTNVSVPFFSNLAGLLSGDRRGTGEATSETENEISPDVIERTSSITGAATEVRAYKVPNPVYAVPTLLLLVLLFAILSLKKTDIPEKAKKILTALHASLIISIIALLFFTFIRAPAITGGAVTIGAVRINLTQENLFVIIPLAFIIISSIVLYYINEKHTTRKR